MAKVTNPIAVIWITWILALNAHGAFNPGYKSPMVLSSGSSVLTEYGRCKENLLRSTSEENHGIIKRFLDYELVRKDRIEAVKLGRNWFIKKDVLERYANRKRTDAS